MVNCMDRDQFDWDAIRQSMDTEDDQHSAERLQILLRQRAQQYAAPKQLDRVTEEAHTVLVFELGSEHYGVDVMLVRNVRTIDAVTRVPGLPRFYRGVVNVRGQVITVLDLRLFLDMPLGEEANPPTEMIVVAAHGLEIGLLAHNVEGVNTVPKASIDPVDNMRYALGVTVDRLVLLDIAHMFQDNRLIVGGKDEG